MLQGRFGARDMKIWDEIEGQRRAELGGMRRERLAWHPTAFTSRLGHHPVFKTLTSSMHIRRVKRKYYRTTAISGRPHNHSCLHSSYGVYPRTSSFCKMHMSDTRIVSDRVRRSRTPYMQTKYRASIQPKFTQ